MVSFLRIHNGGIYFIGVTTVLTMAFSSVDNRKDLPKVPYATALDIYVNGCFAFVTATIIQFAMVHYFTKQGYGDQIYSMVNYAKLVLLFLDLNFIFIMVLYFTRDIMCETLINSNR